MTTMRCCEVCIENLVTRCLSLRYTWRREHAHDYVRWQRVYLGLLARKWLC